MVMGESKKHKRLGNLNPSNDERGGGKETRAWNAIMINNHKYNKDKHQSATFSDRNGRHHRSLPSRKSIQACHTLQSIQCQL